MRKSYNVHRSRLTNIGHDATIGHSHKQTGSARPKNKLAITTKQSWSQQAQCGRVQDGIETRDRDREGKRGKEREKSIGLVTVLDPWEKLHEPNLRKTAAEVPMTV